MSIECFIRWAKSARNKRPGEPGAGEKAACGAGLLGTGGGGLDGAGNADDGCDPVEHDADHSGETEGKGKAGSFVIEDFDAKDLFRRDWEVPIYGPIRRASGSTPANDADGPEYI